MRASEGKYSLIETLTSLEDFLRREHPYEARYIKLCDDVKLRLEFYRGFYVAYMNINKELVDD